MPSIAYELQVLLYGRDVSIQFDISNKTLLFACTKKLLLIFWPI